MKSLSFIFTLFLVASIAFIAQQQPVAPKSAAQQPSSGHRLAQSMQAKLDHIQQNGERANPDQTPTVMTEEEVNDYFAAGNIKLPQGVKKVTFQGRTGVVTAFLLVDFDEIKQGQHTSNPLLSMFNGTHNVAVEGDAAGSGGKATVHVRTVTIDAIEVPRIALEYFVSKYITPKYPNMGLDSNFQLPAKIDTAKVGYHKLTVTQK
jgi:ABC-type transporter MlaC component